MCIIIIGQHLSSKSLQNIVHRRIFFVLKKYLKKQKSLESHIHITTPKVEQNIGQYQQSQQPQTFNHNLNICSVIQQQSQKQNNYVQYMHQSPINPDKPVATYLTTKFDKNCSLFAQPDSIGQSTSVGQVELGSIGHRAKALYKRHSLTSGSLTIERFYSTNTSNSVDVSVFIDYLKEKDKIINEYKVEKDQINYKCMAISEEKGEIKYQYGILAEQLKQVNTELLLLKQQLSPRGAIEFFENRIAYLPQSKRNYTRIQKWRYFFEKDIKEIKTKTIAAFPQLSTMGEEKQKQFIVDLCTETYRNGSYFHHSISLTEGVYINKKHYTYEQIKFMKLVCEAIPCAFTIN